MCIRCLYVFKRRRRNVCRRRWKSDRVWCRYILVECKAHDLCVHEQNDKERDRGNRVGWHKLSWISKHVLHHIRFVYIMMHFVRPVGHSDCDDSLARAVLCVFCNDLAHVIVRWEMRSLESAKEVALAEMVPGWVR